MINNIKKIEEKIIKEFNVSGMEKERLQRTLECNKRRIDRLLPSAKCSSGVGWSVLEFMWFCHAVRVKPSSLCYTNKASSNNDKGIELIDGFQTQLRGAVIDVMVANEMPIKDVLYLIDISADMFAQYLKGEIALTLDQIHLICWAFRIGYTYDNGEYDIYFIHGNDMKDVFDVEHDRAFNERKQQYAKVLAGVPLDKDEYSDDERDVIHNQWENIDERIRGNREYMLEHLDEIEYIYDKSIDKIFEEFIGVNLNCYLC